MSHLHVLRIAGLLKLLVGREVHDGAGLNGDIDIVLGVTGPDLRALGVQGNGDLAALLDLLGLAGIVDDGLCRKKRQALAVASWSRQADQSGSAGPCWWS